MGRSWALPRSLFCTGARLRGARGGDMIALLAPPLQFVLPVPRPAIKPLRRPSGDVCIRGRPRKSRKPLLAGIIIAFDALCAGFQALPCGAASKNVVQRTREPMRVGLREPWRTRTGASSCTLHMMSPLSGARRATRLVSLLHATARGIDARWRRVGTVASRHRCDPVSSAQAKR